MSSLEPAEQHIRRIKIKLRNLNKKHLELEDTMHGALICMALAGYETKPAKIEEYAQCFKSLLFHYQCAIDLIKEIDRMVHQTIKAARELCQAELEDF